MQKKFDIRNPILGNLFTQVNANQVSGKRVKELLGNIKNDEIQRRLDELRSILLLLIIIIMTTVITLTSILMMVTMMITMMIWMLMTCWVNLTTSEGSQY